MEGEKSMKVFKKIGALVLAVMMIAVVGVAWAGSAAPTGAALTDGEIGGTTFPTDAPDVQVKSVILKKEITVYNLDEAKVLAPTITYGYAIEPGTAGVNVTDEDTDHATGVGAITAPTKAGVGTPTITASLSWDTSIQLDAGTDGVANTKDIIVDFSSVVFTGAGVYRYKITETPPTSYAGTGVTEGNDNHVRFLDVYVKPSADFAPLSDSKTKYVPGDWEIYGYVCIDDGADGDTAVTPSTVKTNGFVDSNTSETVSTADKYYTYNVTVSKTVKNDSYAAATHQFPITVIFSNGDITGNIKLLTKTTGTVTDFTRADGTPSWSGHADILSDGSIKYIGIPMGTDVEVYETNDLAGTTYTVETTRTNAKTATATDSTVTSGTIAVTAQGSPKAEYQSTKTEFDTTKDQDDDNVHSVAIKNTLVLISPTGIAMRIAPYALILMAGIALLIVAKKRRPAEEE